MVSAIHIMGVNKRLITTILFLRGISYIPVLDDHWLGLSTDLLPANAIQIPNTKGLTQQAQATLLDINHFDVLSYKTPVVNILPPESSPIMHLLADTTKPKIPNIIQVPFTLTGGIITIKGRVDTTEGNFFFDTGATKLLLNQRYFPQGRRRNTDSRGVTGAVQVLGTQKVDTLLFDNFLKTKVFADVLDLTHIESSKKIALVGILGAAIFENFEILFDYEASLITFIRTDKKGNPIETFNSDYVPCGTSPLKTSTHIALLYLKCGPAQKGIWMGLDSGAEQNLLSKSIKTKFLKENFDVRSRIKLNGMGSESIEVLSGMLKNARVDTFPLQPMATILTDLTNINTAYATEMDGVLGYEFLSQYPMSINFKKRKLTIYKRNEP